MKTDIPLKRLFERHARDLLVLTGDQGARVMEARTVELHEMRRTADVVLKLEREGEVYYRHIEFQGKNDAGMLRRCFAYNTRLILEYDAPVLTTVVYLFPPGPKQEPVFRVRLRGREVNRWRFEWLRLWEIDARAILEKGTAGAAALVPFMRGSSLGRIAEAAERIKAAAPANQRKELITILYFLSGGRYSRKEVERIIGRKKMIESSTWNAVFAEAKAEGKAEGRLLAERELCTEMVRRYHPALADAARAVIARTTSATLLKDWILKGPALDDDAFRRLLSARPRRQASRRRSG